MTILRRIATRIRRLLDVMDAAISVSAAVRSHRVPDRDNLRRLGIDPTPAAMAAMTRA